jgi:uncharacterized protein (DUF58 family)
MAAAALAYLLVRQGDAVGLQAQAASGRVWLPPRTGTPHLRGVLAALARLGAGGAAKPHEAVRRAVDALRRRGLLVVLSDFYDDEDLTLAELRRARAMGHDVSIFQVVTRTELSFRSATTRASPMRSRAR